MKNIKNKKLILVGPTASGKSFLRKKMENRGFTFDVSYTSRDLRLGEENGVHYNFISKEEFEQKIKENFFYEWVEYNGNYYGTGLKEWNTLDCFIMETDGVKSIKSEDRQFCFIIYLDPPRTEREIRMIKEREWNAEIVMKRNQADFDKFHDFINYDIRIMDPYF